MREHEVIEASLKTLVRLGLGAIRANQGSLLLAHESRRMLEFAFVMSRNVLRQSEEMFSSLVGQFLPYGSGVTGTAASTLKPQYSVRENYESFYPIKGDRSPHSVLAVPIMANGALIGVLTAVSFDPDRAFDEESALTYAEYADVAAGLLVGEKL